MKTLLLVAFALAGAAAFATTPALAVNTLPPPPPPPASAAQPAPAKAPSAAPAASSSSSTSSSTSSASSSPSTSSPSTSSADSSSHSTFNDGPDPLGEGTPSIGAFLGFASDNLNFGFGVRGGYTLPQKVYLGGAFTYHVGVSETVPFPGGTISSSVHVYYFMFEGGYDITAGPVVVRPMAGIGPAIASASVSSSVGGAIPPGVGAQSETNFAFMLGGAVFYPIPGSNFAVGGEARVLLVSDYSSFGVFATGAYHF